ncbi:agmatine deiminase family protein [Hyphobacterium sp. HN65]|uniref:Agmatine deiminase family protein n=1 Tax=Hyphobacterium lacteum TaxID=3116575 RepID=A0ABU7LNT9_9PROT|nr:agmatine deiminase family protein [Hyphobacterium sp. HN65]MEE2525553.1 agmatine deiminase family protein [Hyphobacterium sp. HN65]
MTTRFSIPHEFAPQARIYTCWPAAADLWEDNLESAQAEFGAFLNLLAGSGETAQALTILAATDQAEASARDLMGNRAEILRAAYGDVWARDTGPVFRFRDGKAEAVCFRFNGWGGKYELPGDETLGGVIAHAAGVNEQAVDFICEGGALEFDGAGGVLTTRQCLLNPNRNPGITESEAESILKQALGIETVYWVEDGLHFDHTDGHVDNIARFLAPGVVACQSGSGADDPQADVLTAIADQLKAMTTPNGTPFRVVEIPSPGRVTDEDGEAVPASHMNWVSAQNRIVMPVYDEKYGKAAARALQDALPDMTILTSPARSILSGGGAFHCVTCNLPLLP